MFLSKLSGRLPGEMERLCSQEEGKGQEAQGADDSGDQLQAAVYQLLCCFLQPLLQWF